MRNYIFLFCMLFAGRSACQVELKSNSTIGGTYKGNHPCEDCRVIETMLELNMETDSSGQFALVEKYMGKQGVDISSRMKGDWIISWEELKGKKVQLIILNYDLADKTIYYLLKPDGNLSPLDADKQTIKADIDCTLKKE